MVLQEIRRLTEFANAYEDEFVKALIGYSMQSVQADKEVRQKEFDRLTARDRELDMLFERIYEDNVAGKINDERFVKLSAKYKQEQGDISRRMKVLRSDLQKETGQLYTADLFLEIVRRYTNPQELTQRMVTELIDHIEVYHAKQDNGVKTQEIKIHYHCIGSFDVPDWDSIPELQVYIKTRKGVAICSQNKVATPQQVS